MLILRCWYFEVIATNIENAADVGLRNIVHFLALELAFIITSDTPIMDKVAREYLGSV